MTLKNQLLILLLACIASFAAGKFSGPAQTTATEAKTDQKAEDKVCKISEHITTTKAPDGTTKVEVQKDTTIETRKTEIAKEVDSITKTAKPTISLSALIGIAPGHIGPVYGVSAQKQFIGPLSIGAFFLTNGTIGATLGISF